MSEPSIYQQITALLPQLSADEKDKLQAWLKDNPSITMADLIEIKENQGLVCPECGSPKAIVKYGFTNKGIQRYYCKDCDVIFTPLSYTFLSGTHKELADWLQYIHCMVEGYSLRKSAEYCGISLRTAFFWRHKILDILGQKLKRIKLRSIVEADDTFVRESYKGNKPVGREAYKRGEKASKPGLSQEQICISTAIDTNGNSYGKISARGHAKAKEINKAIGKQIKKDAILCTDNDSSYKKFAKDKNLEHMIINTDRHTNGVYNIQLINNFHSRLKDFLRKFKGVSTKYLDNYLSWMSSIVQVKMSIGQVMRNCIKEDYYDTWYEVKDRKLMPV